MAYVSKEKKAKIAAALKEIVPADWKYSLAVRHHSTIVLTIRSAPMDLIKEYVSGCAKGDGNFCNAPTEFPTSCDVNHYHVVRKLKEADSCLADIFEKIIAALNLNNHDNSDAMTDYFDVGHYVSFRLGKWDKPFIVTGDEALKEAA